MRHRVAGRTLGRKSSHRRSMFRNMASSLIRTVEAAKDGEKAPGTAKVPGRIVTTVAKAKELRPYIEKLITLAKASLQHESDAAQFATTAARNSSEWKAWRTSDKWKSWVQARSPAVNLRRRAFARLRDKVALRILFEDLAQRFKDRPGGYTRVVKLAGVRLGDAGAQALIEFVGVNDRKKQKKTRKATSMPVASSSASDATAVPAPPPAEGAVPQSAPSEG